MRSTFSEGLSPETASTLIDQLTKVQERREQQRLFHRLYPDKDSVQPDGSTIHARHKYAKHLEFFEAGAKYRERCFMAATRRDQNCDDLMMAEMCRRY